MRLKLRLNRLGINLLLFSIVFSVFLVQNTFAKVDTSNFYFDDFTADYYLSRDENGISHLKVTESLTAVFPDYNQNKGICRQIPTTNQDGANITLESLTTSDVSLLRNGIKEPIYSLSKKDGFFELCTGDETYLRGKQVYTITYEFKKVITDFLKYQELYWDTNGNGWSQKFNNLTARVHFSPEIKKDYDGRKWCYVGKYKESGQNRCKITEISDGLQFVASNLKSGENLTFDVQFKPGSFVVPEPEKSYLLIVILAVVSAICLLILIFAISRFIKNGSKRRFYKDYFIVPEYAGPKEYSIAEMADIYIGHKKNPKVAVLLDMVVNQKISIRKKEGKKNKWEIVVNSLDGMNNGQKIILKILNAGSEVSDGDVIELKSRSATSSLVSLGKKYNTFVEDNLKKDGLAESKYKASSNNNTVASNIIVWTVMVACFWPLIIGIPIVIFSELKDHFGAGKVLVGKQFFFPTIALVVVLTFLIVIVLSSITEKYKNHTEKGLKMSRYMDGLKLYIKMAEKDRLEFLQSVKNVDVSNEGICKLYEKLLPYAAIFGLEKSWMKELDKYYKMPDVEEPEWHSVNSSGFNMLHAVSLASSYTSRSTSYSSSSISGGGGSSSGWSGGGGGGFSGGGGGGGGGGGR